MERVLAKYKSGKKMNLDDKKKIIQKYLEAYNQFDVDGMLSVLSDDIKFENVQNDEVNASSHGKDEFKGIAEQAKALFEERNQTIENIEDSPEITLVKISYYGKLASDLPNGMKAGDELSLSGASEFVFSDKLICSIRDIS